MKTINTIQKTGNKRFKKVMSQVFAAIVGLLLTSSTASSENLWNHLPGTSSLIENTMATPANEDSAIWASANLAGGTHSSETANPPSTFRIEPATEKSLEIESWMTEPIYFDLTISFKDEMDKPLELEEWMTNDLNFNSTPLICVAEMEKEMPVESWMTDEYFWVN